MSDKKFYLTTTLPYVNADPHIGFALELVHADIIARYKRLQGYEVFFNTGTDEHGQKIFQKAKEENKDVQDYVDYYATRFGNLQNALNISNNAFIRTTNPEHIEAAQELWKRCDKDIYKKKYKGLYCVGDEAYIKESELINGRCPNHPNLDLIEIEEENYFFRLSSYQEKLLKYLERESSALPNWRREEAIIFIKRGLEDFSISREKARMSWGIPVPGDDSQVMYVWFDALSNYISTLGWPNDKEGNFKKFWDGGEVVQMAGKDQIRFQSIMWQAMLMSADVKTTDKVVYHGFVTSNGHKMSKSLGNVIDPFKLVEEYGTEAVRYMLSRLSSFEDSDVTFQRLKEVYNAELANGIGNLASRIMTLAQNHLEATPPNADIDGGDAIPCPNEFTDALDRYDVHAAVDSIVAAVKQTDIRITSTAPFKLIKENPEEGKKLISSLVGDLFEITLILRPILPRAADLIKAAIIANKKPENLFMRKD